MPSCAAFAKAWGIRRPDDINLCHLLFHLTKHNKYSPSLHIALVVAPSPSISSHGSIRQSFSLNNVLELDTHMSRVVHQFIKMLGRSRDPNAGDKSGPLLLLSILSLIIEVPKALCQACSLLHMSRQLSFFSPCAFLRLLDTRKKNFPCHVRLRPKR